jgi:hypothetical protein
VLDIVKKTIDNFYTNKNYQLFKKSCNLPLNLPTKLIQYVEQHKINLVQEGILEDDPSRTWFFHFNKYKNGEFEAEYTTDLSVSRVAHLFYIMHSFEVEHKNKKRIVPSLHWGGYTAYTKQQAELHNEISNVLVEHGYNELKEADLGEVVDGFQMPQDVTIFGKNIDVETLLFRDVLDLCGRADRQKQGAK